MISWIRNVVTRGFIVRRARRPLRCLHILARFLAPCVCSMTVARTVTVPPAKVVIHATYNPQTPLRVSVPTQ